MKKISAVLVAFGMLCMTACGSGTGSDGGTSTSSDGTVPYARNEYYTSFWKTDTIKNETVMLEEDENGVISGELLFRPTEILEIKNYDLSVGYGAEDYTLEGRTIVRTADSEMPYMSYDLLQGEGLEDAGLSSMDGLVFTEGKEIVSRLINVTYRYDRSAEPWTVFPEDQSARLTNLRSKLEAGEEIELFLYGDSIAAGCNASSVLGYAPYLPVWGQAVADELSAQYDTEVRLRNGSVGGWQTADGARNIIEQISVVPDDAPDLAIIAFGMNDGSARVAAKTYYGNMMSIITTIRESSPDCDIVLISTIHANPLCSQDYALTASYDEQNDLLCGAVERCVTVDMTAFSEALYERKDGLDLLANNINHPNDFLVRCYAMNILDAIAGVAE